LFPISGWKKKGISKGIAILISLSFVLAIMVSLLYLLLMQINEFSHEWNHSEKTSGTLNKSVFIFHNILKSAQNSN
jgi:predicted PurR-regulated permease PerM